MKEKLNRAKQFVEAHTIPITYGMAIAAGSAITFRYLKKHPMLPTGLQVDISDTAEAFADGFRKNGCAVIHCEDGFELLLTATK